VPRDAIATCVPVMACQSFAAIGSIPSPKRSPPPIASDANEVSLNLSSPFRLGLTIVATNCRGSDRELRWAISELDSSDYRTVEPHLVYVGLFLVVCLMRSVPAQAEHRVHRAIVGVERWLCGWPQNLLWPAFSKRGSSRCIRIARLLAYYTGQRRHDLVRMDWARFDGERIEVVCQSKSREYLSIPCHPVLLAALLPIRKQSGPIISSRGCAYTANSLSNAFRKVFVQISLDGYSVHGLRKNAAVVLAEVGCEPHEIMAITGHKTLAMVTHYTKRANQKRLADRAMEKWKTAKSS
jgi:hypothetical protein